MRLLVLGGPRFLGRAVAEGALARGQELTFFNAKLEPGRQERFAVPLHDLLLFDAESGDAVSAA